MGIVAVHFDLAATALLAMFILVRGSLRQFPYLSAYVAIRLAQDMVQLRILYSEGLDAASVSYWYSAPILTAALVCVLCEFKRSRMILMVGVMLGIAQESSYILAGMYQWQHEPTMAIQATAAVLVALWGFIALVRDRNNLCALGLFAVASVVAISCDYSFAMNSELLRWIPDFGSIFGLMIWIVWLRRQPTHFTDTHA